MGLTNSSLGIKSFDTKTKINKSPKEKIIALAGNPNVGKSTIFNAFTGMNQHTGNWPGKTVCNAVGNFSSKKHSYTLVDIPGTYSLMAHSDEEEVARNFLCFGDPDGVIVVCDATMLLRNLNLVLQILEICPKTIVCINMMDEAKRKHIKIDIKKLSKRLSVPVVPVVAQKKKSLLALADTLDKFYDEDIKFSPPFISYPAKVEEAIATVEAVVRKKVGSPTFSRWISLKLLEDDEGLKEEMAKYFGEDFFDENIYKACFDAKFLLETLLIDSEKLKDMIVCSINKKSEEILEGVVISEKKDYSSFDRKLDKFFTSKLTGYPVMILLLALIFWITISGANYPSQLLSTGLFYIEDRLIYLFDAFGVPNIITDALIRGVYNVLAWVVSVMLPPMAIFFPLFTLLEDSGYLPRVAYNLDKPFQKCCACGKHALTMCMGFGCNCAGIVGSRIIDSKREKLLAILTNNFVPCNGRFPAILTILTIFFVGTSKNFSASILSALLLTLVILLGIFVTFIVTKILSKTILKGVPSSFTLELPPYRKPQIGKVIVRSIFDRTIFVLGRAVTVAAPAGLIIWLMANVTVGDASLLNICSDFLDPFARFFGLDGVILMAFILGFPANEIVIPIIIMAYLANGTLTHTASIIEMGNIFIENGWTVITAICTILFFLMHWPCSTALITIKKETGSLKWTALAFLIPTVVGLFFCALVANIGRIFI